MNPDAFAVSWSPARRDVTRLPEKVAAAAVAFIYGRLAANLHRVGVALRLQLDGLHRARRGDYRVICAIDDAAGHVRIVTIEHRSDVYRRRP